MQLTPRSRWCVPLMLRAGAPLPRRGRLFMDENDPCFDARLRDYVVAVGAAGGFDRYARAHVARIAEIFETPLLPPELVRKVVEFWLHAGWY